MNKPSPSTNVVQPLLVSEAEAARILGLGKRKMWELGNRGENGDHDGVPRVRVGRRVLYDIIDLSAFVDRQKGRRR